jgi:alcohol dehydrogenase
LRHTAGLFAPKVATAFAPAALERDAGQRLRRVAMAAGDRVRQRVRPSRPLMRTLTVSPGLRLAWRDVPVPPPPGRLGAIVHPVAVATCDLDRALALGATPFALPVGLGHECVAEVLEVGERVTDVRPGQLVVVPFQINCGACPPCRGGRTGNCTAVPPLSMYGFGLGGGHWGGALSDQLLVPFADAMLVPLPGDLEPAAAASVCDNVSDGFCHIAPHLPGLLERDPDTEVLIIAAVTRGSMFSPSVALYAGLAARALGARHVHLVDERRSVRDHAERLSLHAMRPEELRGQAPVPLVVDSSAHPRGLRAALSHTAPDGICTSAGGVYGTARIPAGLLYSRNATYHVGRTHSRAMIPQVLDLMTSGRFHPEAVTTTVAPLDDAPRALRQHYLTDSTKTILTA